MGVLGLMRSLSSSAVNDSIAREAIASSTALPSTHSMRWSGLMGWNEPLSLSRSPVGDSDFAKVLHCCSIRIIAPAQITCRSLQEVCPTTLGAFALARKYLNYVKTFWEWTKRSIKLRLLAPAYPHVQQLVPPCCYESAGYLTINERGLTLRWSIPTLHRQNAPFFFFFFFFFF